MIFQFLEAARARVEHRLPPYGDLWQEPFEEEKQRFMESQETSRVLQRSSPNAAGRKNGPQAFCVA